MSEADYQEFKYRTIVCGRCGNHVLQPIPYNTVRLMDGIEALRAEVERLKDALASVCQERVSLAAEIDRLKAELEAQP